jgi:hypothetical protein
MLSLSSPIPFVSEDPSRKPSEDEKTPGQATPRRAGGSPVLDYRYRLHYYQSQCLQLPHRFKAFISGVQGGKTTFGCFWLWHIYQQCGGSDMLIVGPTYRMLTQSTMAKFLQVTPPGWGHYHEHKGVYETRWGHKFYVRSGAKPDSIEGMTVGGAWLDEASLLRADVWPIVQGRIAIKQGPALFTTTPRGQNWFWHDVYRPAMRQDPAFGVVQFRSVDSPYFPVREALKAKERMRPSIYRQRYGGLFERIEGLIYDCLDRGAMTCKPFDVERTGWPMWAGVDFGYRNPFVWLVMTYNPKKGRYYICGLYYKSGRYIQDHVPELIRRFGKDGIRKLSHVFCDPSGTQEMEDLRREFNKVGLDPEIQPAWTGPGTKMAGISDCYALVKSDQLRVFDLPEMEPFWDESSLYQFDSDVSGRFLRDRPKDEDNHAMDGWRYAYASKLRVAEPMIY